MHDGRGLSIPPALSQDRAAEKTRVGGSCHGGIGACDWQYPTHQGDTDERNASRDSCTWLAARNSLHSEIVSSSTDVCQLRRSWADTRRGHRHYSQEQFRSLSL